MPKTVFISYHFNDKTYKGEIVRWLEEAGFQTISTDEEDLRPVGDKAIEDKIKDQIKQSAHLLVLVGNDTHNRPWVDYEVKVAASHHVARSWVRLSNRTGAAPQEVRSLPEIPYDKSAIIQHLKNS